jgi:hypothetical protein
MPHPPRFNDPKVRERFLAAIRAGSTYKLACQIARVDFKTYLSWKAKAKAADPDPELVEFMEDLEIAEAEGALAMLTTIRRATQDIYDEEYENVVVDGEIVSRVKSKKLVSRGQWQAGAWILERRYPEEYGRPEARLGVVPTEEPTGATDEAKVDAVTKAMGLDTTNAPTDE